MGYILNLFPSKENKDSLLVGRYIADLTEKRRSGSASKLPDEDRWIFETLTRGGASLPRLKWSRQRGEDPIYEHSHLSLAFDVFRSCVVSLTEDECKKYDLHTEHPIEAFGLFPSIKRTYAYDPEPTWVMSIAKTTLGERHPISYALTQRIEKCHTAILNAVVNNLDKNNISNWPALKSRILNEQDEVFRKLHNTSDWVITIDRNAGLEYFDAPKINREVYDTYVIDCVPERQDLQNLQLVTSTSKIDEIKALFDKALAEMALSCSPRNCDFLLSNLKAISGRLAMRMANEGNTRSELIALALFYATCKSGWEDPDFLNPKTGFFVPLDDIRELMSFGSTRNFKPTDNDQEEKNLRDVRSDLVYVKISNQGKLQFTFVEIKYRRLLRSAKDSDIIRRIGQQTSGTRERWNDLFFNDSLKPIELVLRRKVLARALFFYANKARRHELEQHSYGRIISTINKLHSSEVNGFIDYSDDRGYVFCPEYNGGTIKVSGDGFTKVFLFGPEVLPDVTSQTLDISLMQDKSNPLPASYYNNQNIEEKSIAKEFTSEKEEEIGVDQDSKKEGLSILFGYNVRTDALVTWNPSIQGNPHLMIVGQPGMGKTGCIINICTQYYNQGIMPIAFDYHGDVELRLKGKLEQLNIVDLSTGLGFNPMQIVGTSPFAWIDNIGMLRDIFAAIYQDFGDIQTNVIREALKESYVRVGYGNPDASETKLQPPSFQSFYDLLRNDILRRDNRANQGIIARLDELNDYRFFQAGGEKPSPLYINTPTIIRLHGINNDKVQNALASFILFNIYKNMFMRGKKDKLTHTVIFDEAHRAAKLTLIPKMAKECRKYGISFILSSQSSKDFDEEVYPAIANYLILRTDERDANFLAKKLSSINEVKSITDKLKKQEKFHAMVFFAGQSQVYIRLKPIS